MQDGGGTVSAATPMPVEPGDDVEMWPAGPTYGEWKAQLERLNSPAGRSARGRLANYGITLDDFEAMLKRQGGACAICRDPLGDESRCVHVDHDHGCSHPRNGGKSCRACVRGILCRRCNMLAGWIEGNRSFLPAVLAYLDAPASERPLSAHTCPVTGCETRIPPDGKLLCSWHWGRLSTQVQGRWWDGRATDADIIDAVNRKVREQPIPEERHRQRMRTVSRG